MRRTLAALIVFIIGVGAVVPAGAQLIPATTRIVRLVGPVELRLAGGTAPWAPATVGAQLGEQDEIRALGGASAELSLPDGSTLILAENSRFVVSRLRVDSQNQGRSAIFHLATGKLRAIVNQAAVRLVQLRQSTFAISTPTAVAAVRGTDLAVTYASPMTMAVRGGQACCIAVATGIGIPVPDGFTTDSDTGFVCALPKAMTPQEERVFYATINPAGILHPMMNLPVTIVDPTLVESWGCDELAARRGEEQPITGTRDTRPEGFPVSISPSTLRPRFP
jgi:FecR-like protein